MEFERMGTSGCVASIDAGLVEGRRENGAWAFLGIPYAKPPLGELRWKPPQPVPPWEGVRPCAQFGDSCPQPESDEYGLGGMGEDCLHLNVWAPEGSGGERLPVMVWIHGGAFIIGSASVELHRDEKLYSGAGLARRGVIVVTMNYRLGPFGFFAHPRLARESPDGLCGNYGLMDQLAALAWVRRNIASFGGDASRVTLFGQSAGATSICCLMVNPAAGGLFRRAIIESSPLWMRYADHPATQTMEAALRRGEELAQALGIEDSPHLLGEMRARSYDEVIAAAGMGAGFPSTGIHFGPAIDGRLLPDRPEALLSAGKGHGIDVIVGSNRNEAALMVMAMDYGLDEYRDFAARTAGPLAGEALRLFAAEDDSGVKPAMSRMITALEFTSPARFIARCVSGGGSGAYLYHFSPTLTTRAGGRSAPATGRRYPTSSAGRTRSTVTATATAGSHPPSWPTGPASPAAGTPTAPLSPPGPATRGRPTSAWSWATLSAPYPAWRARRATSPKPSTRSGPDHSRCPFRLQKENPRPGGPDMPSLNVIARSGAT